MQGGARCEVRGVLGPYVAAPRERAGYPSGGWVPQMGLFQQPVKTTCTPFHSVKTSRLTSYFLSQVLSQTASAGKMLGPEPTTGGDANQSCTVSRHLRKCGALVWASKAALFV